MLPLKNEPLSPIIPEAIHQGIADFRTVLDTDGVDIDMETWTSRTPQGCTVCMAGAVLTQRDAEIHAGYKNVINGDSELAGFWNTSPYELSYGFGFKPLAFDTLRLGRFAKSLSYFMAPEGLGTDNYNDAAEYAYVSSIVSKNILRKVFDIHTTPDTKFDYGLRKMIKFCRFGGIETLNTPKDELADKFISGLQRFADALPPIDARKSEPIMRQMFGVKRTPLSTPQKLTMYQAERISASLDVEGFLEAVC